MNDKYQTVIDPLTGKASVQKVIDNSTKEVIHSGGGGTVNSIRAGSNITVDDSDPTNPIVASTASGGVSIGDTIGGTPANGGLLYADSSDTLRANHWATGTSSYAGGAVTGIKLEQQVIADAPRFEVLNLSGFGIPNAFALATSTDPFSFFLTDTDTLTTYVAMTINPATPASSNVTFGLASGTSSNPEFALTTVGLALRVPIDMNNNKITELATPTDSTDASTKGYVDGIIPSQTGNSGKFLTTNGTTVSWAAVSASPGGSDTQIQYNNSGSFAGMTNVTKSGDGLLFSTVGNESFIAIGPQGDYGTSFAQDEPHLAINTVRLIGSGGNSLTLRNGSNTNNITLFTNAMAAASYVTPSNGITGFYLTENGGNNAATVTMASTDQGFFARKARLQVQAESGLISADATINTIQAKAQTSQTGNLFDAVNTSGTRLWGIDQTGAMKPASMADSAAANDTVYYSTDASKLVYKDSGGSVNNLY